MCGMMTWRVFQLLFYQTGVGVSGAPRQDEVANFVNFTNILGQPCWAAGRAGGETGWLGHANNTYAPTSLLTVDGLRGGGTLCCHPRFVLATR